VARLAPGSARGENRRMTARALRVLFIVYIVSILHSLGWALLSLGRWYFDGVPLISLAIELISDGAIIVAMTWIHGERRDQPDAVLSQVAIIMWAMQALASLLLHFGLHLGADSLQSISFVFTTALPALILAAASLFTWLALSPLANDAGAPAGR